MSKKKNDEKITPEEAAKSLAALIPSPEDAVQNPDAIVPASEVPDGKSQASEVEVGMITAAAPAPPLQTLEIEEPKTTKRKAAASRRKPTAADGASAKKTLKKMLPASVRAVVYKRNRNGQMGFVSDYSANDLAGEGSIERFLKEYVVDEYGYGEYAVYFQETGKDPVPAGSVTIEEPASHRRRREGGTSETRELLELFAKQQAEAAKAAASRKSPAEEMRETIALLQSMQSSEEKKTSMDPSLLLMMMMMRDQKPEPSPGIDPLTLKLIERIERMEEERNAASFAQMPPPPPPPQPDPMEGFAAMMKVISEQQSTQTQLLLESIKSREPQRNPIEDLVTLTRLTGANDDRLTTKDFLAMLPTIKGFVAPNEQKNSLAEALETMRQMKMIEREFGGGQESSASGFWDFLRDFIQSDAGSRIAEAITAEQSVRAVNQRHEARRQAMGANAPPSEQQVASGGQEDQGLVIPETFREKNAVEINTASTPQERLSALIRGMQHLGTFPAFRPYMARIIGLMKENRKVEAIDFIGKFLDGMIEAGVLEVEPCQKAIDDLEEFWDLVRKSLGMPDIPEVYPEGYEPEEKAEAQEDSSEEFDEDEEEDLAPESDRNERSGKVSAKEELRSVKRNSDGTLELVDRPAG